jgi:hypothetical protein
MQLKKITLALCAIVTSLSFAQAPSSVPAGTMPAAKPPAPMTAPAPIAPAPMAPAPMAPKAMAPAAATPPAVTAPGSTPVVAPAAAMKKSKAPTAAAAEGGGSDKVWMNAKSSVYHCPGSKYYGKTKEGSYMTEADAKAKGGHAVKNKACGI